MSEPTKTGHNFETLEIEFIGAHIAHVKLNRPR